MSDDRRAILNLLGEYTHRQDGGDLDAVVELFAHATLAAPGRWGPVRGRDAIAQLLASMASGLAQQHICTDAVVLVDRPSGTAVARSRFTMSTNASGALRPHVCGRYLDTFTRIGATWRFASRTFYADLGVPAVPVAADDPWEQGVPAPLLLARLPGREAAAALIHTLYDRLDRGDAVGAGTLLGDLALPPIEAGGHTISTNLSFADDADDAADASPAEGDEVVVRSYRSHVRPVEDGLAIVAVHDAIDTFVSGSTGWIWASHAETAALPIAS